MTTLTFLGATQQVTGSCYLIDTGKRRILLECGMYQGELRPKTIPDKLFRFDPKKIDAVVLSHAHLDHSGLLPALTRQGFKGPIFATTPTSDLLAVMLKDAAYLQEKDVEWENKKRNRSGKDPVLPLYEMDDVDKVLDLIETIDYGQRTKVIEGIDLCFHDAGHIIGSAIVELWIKDKAHSKKLVFSGDLGNSSSPLLRDPEIVQTADLLLLESTYGDRDHRPASETRDELQQALTQAYKDGGNVYIPAFAVGRTQDIIFRLGQFYHKGELKQQKVFLDSPMATSVSEIYTRYTGLYNKEHPEFNEAIREGGWKDWLPILSYTRSTEESMALNTIVSGAIIIAGSGMCTGGRIRHHLKHGLWRDRNHIIFVGFQARGTLGRALVDGARQVRFMGEEFSVNAQIHTLGGFSAHAGQSQLLEWAGKFTDQRPVLYLVHGEVEKMLALQKMFHARYGWYASIPDLGETITL